jgi:hypothetical protein
MLVRKGGKRDHSEKSWFLIKEKDEYAEPGSDVGAEEPLSVTSGRDLEEIAVDADREWGPNGEIKKRGSKHKPTARGNHTTNGRSRLVNAEQSSNEHAASSKTRTPKPQKLSAKDRIAINKELRRIGTKRSTLPTTHVQLATLVSEARQETTGSTKLNLTVTGCSAEYREAKPSSLAVTERTGPRGLRTWSSSLPC